MEIIKCLDYDDLSKKAACIFIDKIKNIEKPILGLATGSTPLGLYKNLVKAYKDKVISFKNAITCNLDEYLGLDEDDEMSYHYYMKENLIDKVDILKDNFHIPDSHLENPKIYDEILDKIGRRSIQLLGVGENGHIAFNEPNSFLSSRTSIVKLTENTIEVNSRFFENETFVPRKAITMGIKDILNADEIILLANGKKKENVIRNFIKTENIDPNFPISFLKLHDNLKILISDMDIE